MKRLMLICSFLMVYASSTFADGPSAPASTSLGSKAIPGSTPSNEDNEPGDRVVPPSRILTTGPQKGMRHVRNVFQQADNGQGAELFLRQLHDVSNNSSDVFLVDATDVMDALSASLSVLIGAHSADTPASGDAACARQGSYWLVAYLGTGPSSPTWWTVDHVVVGKNRVVLSYRKSKPAPATDDVQFYYYWVPLGRLDNSHYEIQLFDGERRATTLMRRVDVKATN
jgi:hypothetical protein